MKTQAKPRNKSDLGTEKVEKVSNAQLQQNSKLQTDEHNFQKKHLYSKFTTNSSQIKIGNEQRDSLLSNRTAHPLAKGSKWMVQGPTETKLHQSPSKNLNRLNNKVKEKDLAKDTGTAKEEPDLNEMRLILKKSLKECKANPGEATYKQLMNNVF